MTPRLDFGYLYDFRNPRHCERPWSDVYAETLDVIAWSETVGFSGAWVPEHHNAGDGYQPAPMVALAAIAARTNTLRLGSAVSLGPLYHPLRFAEECAVLDILSRGRAEMSLGIGYRRSEYDAFGLDFKTRGKRFDEFLHIVRALWAGETVNFEGRHFTVKDAKIMPPAPRGRVPLYIGGFADKALERVAKYADGYFGNEEFCDSYAAKLQEQGKDPVKARIRIQGLFYVVAEDPEKAMEELAPYYHHVNNSYGEWLNEDNAIGFDDAALKPMSLDDFKTSGILEIATPDKAISKFEDLQERTKAEHFMMMMPAGLPAERFMEYAQVFADKVIPAFR
ncbi:LLM class flavin-dependent oxidoreductase [Rhodococcus sp. B50]|uniref:LLM class flavin-dependent oxidoreductase n=1 Tax=Rhodococcus sp. B50 TaxID=2682847 RepID=UPI001BD56A73|nr:LLM class flavin-dependent oxidoreductase [Rhodococcus sp. B50]MBS9376088.1 Limonene 1,2-monooxygenase [Rhodococcus sp. B50]